MSAEHGKGARPAAARSRIVDAGWVGCWAAASSLWCLSAAGQLSGTFDETLYVSAGLEFWRSGSHAALLKKGVMPLPMHVDALPLAVLEWWRSTPFDLVADFEMLLRVARAGALVFWWLLLAYAWRIGNLLAGPWAGRVAVAGLASEPNLLAHASLATADVPVSACLLALAYHFRVGREETWVRRVGLPALWYAVALLCKASALLLGPVALLVIEADRACRAEGAAPSRVTDGRWWRERAARLRPLSHDLVPMVTLSLVLVVAYCGSDWQASQRFQAWARTLPDDLLARATIWLSDHLRVFPNAFDALWYQIHHNLQGHAWAYILGESHRHAVWYYFPVLLTIKLSLPPLLAPLLLASVRPRALGNWACALAAVMVLVSVAIRVQIGVRLVLPLVCFAVIGLAAAGVRAYRETAPRWTSRALRAAAVLAVLWTSGTSLAVWPHGLSYVNELWGGPARGHHLVSDSNYDWGQGLKDLARWRREHGDVALAVWYFGTDPSLGTLPFTSLPLHALTIAGPDDVLRHAAGHHLAVSATLLYGPPVTTSHERARSFLETRPPVARTATFFIYDFTGARPGGTGSRLSR